MILPILAVLLARDALPRLKEDIPAALFYITNWVYIVREVPYFEAFGRPPLLQQLWSLAVEEQFYLLWPLLLLFLLHKIRNNRFGLLVATSSMIAISSIWMAILYRPDADPLRVYYGTDTRAAGFLVGAMLALISSPVQASHSSSKETLELLGWGGLVTLVILYNQLNEFQPFLYRGGVLITAVSSAFLIIGASSPATLISKLLETRPLRWIESPVRHYGFRASFRSLRATFKRWSVPRKLGVGAGLVSASMLLIWQSSIHQINNQSTEEIPTLQSVSSVGVMHTTPTKLSLVATQPATSLTTNIYSTRTATPATNLPRVTLIGDSIMQGATPTIEDVLGADIYIDAARKRRMEDVPALVETLYKAEHLSHIVVIHLGSNRPFEDSAFDEVMKRLLAHQVERVIFINVHRPIGWEYYINRKFAEDVARWPQAELIDWDTKAHSEQGWFIRDQTHLSYDESKAYVAAIKDKLDAIR